MKLSVDVERCAPFTRAAEIDPIGSAGFHHSFVLVEVNLPWPREITDIGELAGVRDIIAEAEARDGRLARVLGVVPPGKRRGGPVRVIHYHRSVDGPVAAYEGREVVVDRGDEVATVRAMLADPAGAAFTPVAGRDVLICTHGSRDVCCGGDGMRLHLAAAARFSDARVWRCSHTGGHRYAPTSITFPDGRYWAFLDEARLAAVVRRSGDPAALGANNRGSAGFASPFAQVAERAMFEHVGWQIVDGTTWVEHETADEQRGTVTIVHRARSTEMIRLRVESSVKQHYPAMTCGEGADPSGKTFTEYQLDAVTTLN